MPGGVEERVRDLELELASVTAQLRMIRMRLEEETAAMQKKAASSHNAREAELVAPRQKMKTADEQLKQTELWADEGRVAPLEALSMESAALDIRSQVAALEQRMHEQPVSPLAVRLKEMLVEAEVREAGLRARKDAIAQAEAEVLKRHEAGIAEAQARVESLRKDVEAARAKREELKEKWSEAPGNLMPMVSWQN